jgi:hypothetical protein
MNAMVRYEAARSALAEARRVDEVKDIRDKAEAVRCYARQAKDRQLEVDAVEIRVRAERRLGELLREGRQAGVLASHGGGRPRKGADPALSKTTIKKIGIDRKLSARAGRLADIPSDRFEQNLQNWRADALFVKGRVTPASVGEPDLVKGRAPIEQAPFRLSTTDVRRMTVGEVRYARAVFAGIVDHCGGAQGGELIGDLLTDEAIAALAGRC